MKVNIFRVYFLIIILFYRKRKFTFSLYLIFVRRCFVDVFYSRCVGLVLEVVERLGRESGVIYSWGLCVKFFIGNLFT